ncbi:MAG TPA: TIR domain-containing protein [Pyrinomonadaceae bacterium]|nr:TIR domain-containing protein [Pyrinomonadaceae bacterium]
MNRTNSSRKKAAASSPKKAAAPATSARKAVAKRAPKGPVKGDAKGKSKGASGKSKGTSKGASKASGGRRRRGGEAKYAVAKIVLLGEAGVGKTALGWCLTGKKFSSHPTNHPMQFWLLEEPRITLPDGTRCDVVLWDMASQQDYRLIHPLSTDDANLALIVFDPSLRPDTLAPVRYWLNHLAGSRKNRCPTILVAARTEVGAPVLTKKEIQAFCKEHGIAGGYVATSAVTGEGLKELKHRIKTRFGAGGMKGAEVVGHFHTIKDLVLELKRQGRRSAVIFSPEQMLNRLCKAGVSNVGRQDLLEVARQLAGYGYVRLIGVSQEERRILLVPELFDALAASFVSAARKHPLRLGVLEEESVLANEYDFPELRGLSAANQQSLLRSVVFAFLERNLTLRCLREVVGKKSLLFFPDLVTLKRPRTGAGHGFFDGASYTVRGDTEYLFAVLVVTLGYTNMFTSTEHWDNMARYELEDGVVCGFRIEDEREGELDLVLFFNSKAEAPQTLLQGLVENFLLRRKLSFSRYDPVTCRNGDMLDRSVVRGAQQDGRTHAYCPGCGEKLKLPKPVESSKLPHAELRKVREQEWFAQQRRRFELAIFKVKEHARAQKLWRPECFISYAWGDKEHEQWVERKLATDMEKAGVDVLLDRWENRRIGAGVVKFIDRIRDCDKVVVVGTPAYRMKYDNKQTEKGFVVAAEGRLMSPRILGTEAEKESILPVLLAGSPAESFPPWLQDSVYADFLDERAYFTNAFDLILSVYGIDSNTPAMAELRGPLAESE